jgi:glycosyltransferase involved in cell wall biosynthesis
MMKTSSDNLRVAYIVSMKSGLPAWNFREIDILLRNGVDIWLYPTKLTPGTNMPKPEWRVRQPNVIRTILAQPRAFIASPAKYLKLLMLAIKMRTVVEFLLAEDYAQEMKANGIEHIHCHFGDRKLFTGYFCHRILDLPLSVTVHAYEITMNPNPEMFKLAAAACKTVVVQSEFNKNEIINRFGVDSSKIRVIRAHGDVCDERLHSSVKLLIAAGFTEKKGHDILFKAVKKLNRSDIIVWVAGSGKLDVPRMAKEIGVDDQVMFLGPLGKDLLQIVYESCDIFVHPSRTTADGDREGIPVAIMEAMSHRKPVISTRHTGIPELLPEILVEENDVDGLAEAIAFLADNPKVRKEMGERNYQIIKQNFSDDAVLELKSVFASSDRHEATTGSAAKS